MTLETPYPRTVTYDSVTRWPSGLVPPRGVLDGRVVRLEPLDPARHAAELHEASHADDDALRVWQYLPDGPWPDQAAFTEWLCVEAARFERIAYAVHSKPAGRFRGMASYLDIQPRAGVIEIGYIWFAPDLQRTRGATEALFLMLAHAMDDLGYRRMQWRCNALNEKSRTAARRLGFRFEGVFYQNMIVKGLSRDTAWYSILDHEWPEVRQIIGDWLADDNFEPDGRAKSSLGEMMRRRSTMPPSP